ncbi:MAG: hypothetical protein HN427_03995 [Flavobacteriales bacterium]|jgi:hypothetical protein|nr:hypothetical protein [Flavobacteriales bacterium]MBT6013788.1 hypothetical protein [Flavobacteriales bacterium]
MIKKLLFYLIIISFNFSSFSQSYNDGLNDDFEPKGVSIENYEIYIYSRWGDEVFYSDNIDYHWDGGKGVSGSYGYVINIVDKLGEFHQVKGNVLLEKIVLL